MELQSIIPLKDIRDDRKWSLGFDLVCNGRWFRVVETSCGEDSWLEIISGRLVVDRENDVTWLNDSSYTGPAEGFETQEEFFGFVKRFSPWTRTTWAFHLSGQILIKCATGGIYWPDDTNESKEAFRRLMELAPKELLE